MKKITIQLNGYKKLDQMCDFAVANRQRFVPDLPAATALPELISAVTNLNVLTSAQTSLENRLRELLRAKLDARAALREEMEFLYHTAHAIAAESPGFDDKFQLSSWG